MTKTFIPISFGKNTYKLSPLDLKRVYKIHKRKAPSLPSYDSSEKPLPETDEDIEVIAQSKA